MNRKLGELRNLGPKTEKMLAEVDVFDEEQLRSLGAVEAFRRLRFRFGKQFSLVGLYALEAALQERDWRDLDTEEKARLKDRVAGM